MESESPQDRNLDEVLKELGVLDEAEVERDPPVDAIVCPMCSAKNPTDATHCTNCRVNLKLALKGPDEIEHIRRESTVIHSAVGHEPESRHAAAFSGWRLWLVWTLATIAGLAIGSLPLTAIDILEPSPTCGLMLIFLPLAGACLGTAQWLVLRRRIPVDAAWILTSALGFANVLFQGLSAVVPAQQDLLEEHVRDGGDWRGTSLVAWLGALIGAGLLFFGREMSNCGLSADAACQPDTSFMWRFWTIELPAILVGLVVGAVTGIELVSLLEQPRIEA